MRQLLGMKIRDYALFAPNCCTQ